jgi:hypothetical protein
MSGFERMNAVKVCPEKTVAERVHITRSVNKPAKARDAESPEKKRGFV